VNILLPKAALIINPDKGRATDLIRVNSDFYFRVARRGKSLKKLSSDKPNPGAEFRNPRP
jgi:DNA replication initiation complex subunit (GINS family)